MSAHQTFSIGARQGSFGITRRRTGEVTESHTGDAAVGHGGTSSVPSEKANEHMLAAITTWKSEFGTLTLEQQKLFLETASTGSFPEYVKSLQKTIEKKNDKDYVFRFARKMKPIYDLVSRISPVMSTVGQFTPAPVAFSAVLGGITSILAATVRVDDYQERLVDMLASMASELSVLDKYASESIFADDPNVQASHVDVATDILKFCVAATKLIFTDKGKERTGISLALKIHWKDFNAQFGDIMRSFKQHVVEMERWRNLANSRRLRAVQLNLETVGESVNRGRGELKEVAERLLDADAKLAIEDKRRRILSWLPALPFARVQEDIFERRVEGTGEWLVQHAEFLRWQRSDTSALLWVHGKAGSGKSHLAARVIHDLQQQQQLDPSSMAVAYVFCSSTRSDTQMDFNSILGSILAQLYEQLPLSEDIQALVSRATSGSKEGPQRAEMKEWINTASAKFQSCFIVIDGLDECSNLEENHFSDLCNFIAALVTPRDSHPPLKLIVFTRPNYPIISRVLTPFPQLQVDHGANDADIQAYIQQEVDTINPNPSPEEEPGFEDIKERMLEQADGMFLYVRLKMSDLREIGNIEDILETLQDPTEGLEDLYLQSIRRILGRSRFVRDRALKALLWVTNSFRRLSKTELLDALSTRPGRMQLNATQRLSAELSLSTECADLLVEVDGSYQLVHSSLREFLVSRASDIPGYGELQVQADTILARTCLTYLTFDNFRHIAITTPEVLGEVMKQYPLLDYASTYWGEHFSHVKDSIKSLGTLAGTFLSSPGSMDMCIKTMEYNEFTRGYFIHPGDSTPLHVVALYNLHELATTVPGLKRFVNDHDQLLHLPIDYAFIYEAKDVVLWILNQYQTEPEDSPHSFARCLDCCQVQLLHNAAHLDWDEVILSLISLGCDANSPDELSLQTPLQVATKLGKHAAMASLLKAGANPDHCTGPDNRPLRLALEADDSLALSLLLSSAAEVNVRDDFLLRVSVKRGHFEHTLQLLLHGADINALNNGGTVLHTAIFSGDSDMAMFLINHGASLEQEAGPDGLTPLGLAVAKNDIQMIETLIDLGANIKAVFGAMASNCLHVAAFLDSFEAAELLLRHWHDPDFVDAVDGRGRTPFHVALKRLSTDIAWRLLGNGARSDVLRLAKFLPSHLFPCDIARIIAPDYPDDTDSVREAQAIKDVLHLALKLSSEQQGPSSDGRDDGKPTNGLPTWGDLITPEKCVDYIWSIVDKTVLGEHSKPASMEDDSELSIYDMAWRYAFLIFVETGAIRLFLRNVKGKYLLRAMRAIETRSGIATRPSSSSAVSMDAEDDPHGQFDADPTGAGLVASRGSEDGLSIISHEQPASPTRDADSVGGEMGSPERHASDDDSLGSSPARSPISISERDLSPGPWQPHPRVRDASPAADPATLWTEITNDLVTVEAVTQMGYRFDETKYFVYVQEYLNYDQVLDLVNLSDYLRAKDWARGAPGAIRAQRRQQRRRWYKYKSRSGDVVQGSNLHHPLRRPWKEQRRQSSSGTTDSTASGQEGVDTAESDELLSGNLESSTPT